MSTNFLNSLGMLGMQSTSNGLSDSQSSSFQQNLQQLEQNATSNPQAAVQLLQSLPPKERHALMQALEQQNPQAAQNIHTAFEQQSQQAGQSATTQNALPSIIQLAQGIGKMLGGANGQPAPTTAPSNGYSSLSSMTA